MSEPNRAITIQGVLFLALGGTEPKHHRELHSWTKSCQKTTVSLISGSARAEVEPEHPTSLIPASAP
eukprot:4537682-Pyramimonas_sp.AAC.1